ncbi:MAG: hypothetical protein ACTHVE_06830 [Senegalia sp. (in: firmicutes)]|uniref:hypothetical protein n=1 Tax=Senegalia sp. (in: firmicutes) TaxID=1924098 RepID=UPI003F9A4DF5
MKRKTLILCILILIIFTSCTKKEDTEIKEEEKVSEKLSQMEEKTKKIIENIEKIVEEDEKPLFVEEKENDEKESEEDSSGQGGDSEESGSSSAGESGSSEQSQALVQPEEKTYEEKKEEEKIKRDEKIEKDWMDLSKEIEKIHKDFNKYKIEAIEEGINSDIVSQTENHLNNLTIAIGKKEKINSLKQADKLIFSLGNYFDLYKGNVEGDLNRITYTMREAYLYALEDNFENANKVAIEYESYFSMLNQKIDIEKKDKKHLDTLQVSIKDLINSLKYNDPDLVKIKRDIVLENVKKIKEIAN